MKYLWVDKKVFDGDWTTMALVSTVAPPNDDSVLMHISKPLSDEEIEKIAKNFFYGDWDFNCFDSLKFARAIEERHGIK